MEIHEMEKEKAPSLHLTHDHLTKMGFPAEHLPQAGDHYGVSGVVHVEGVTQHEDGEGKSQHVHLTFKHMGMERQKEDKSASAILYPSHNKG